MDQNVQQNGHTKQQVLEAEIVGHGDESGKQNYRRDFAGAGYGSLAGYWGGAPLAGTGCLGPAITFALCMICLGEYGVLAAIGFFVFYVIGSILGTLHATSRLMAGRPVFPWAWRTGNWIISFLLTVWLAGGFTN